MSEVERVEKTCGACGHTFSHRRYQKIVTCPGCKRRVDQRTGDRHSGAGVFIRLSEAEKDRLERLAHEQFTTQAELLRDALDMLFEKHGA